MGASPIGAGLPPCLFCAGVQPRLRSLYRYTMCKHTTNPPARTVGVSSEPSFVGVSLSGIGRLAAQPPLREARSASVSTRRAGRLRIVGSVLEEPSERIRGKRAFLGPVRSSERLARVGLSALLLTSPLKLAPASASAALDFSHGWRPAACCLPSGGRRRGCARKAATWLILPVVICLSQRLSHACLSINCFIL